MNAPETDAPKGRGGGGALRSALASRVLVADGAMGTMLQASAAVLDDFQGHEGGNEILNVSRPDIVRSLHEAYLSAGADCVTTNTFGANFANLGEYGIADRITELPEAGARIACEAMDAVSRPGHPRWVELTEEMQLVPGRSTDAIVVHHPEAKYFST